MCCPLPLTDAATTRKKLGDHSQPRRSMLKVPMTGQEALQHLVNVHFTSRDLAACMQRPPGRMAMLHFVFNPQVIAAIVTHNLKVVLGNCASTTSIIKH